MGSFLLHTQLPAHSANVVNIRSHLEDSVTFGGSPMNKTRIRLSRSNCFACARLFTQKRDCPRRFEECGWRPFCFFLLLLTYHLPQSNILIDEEGSPRLTDFGFSSITKNVDSIHASTPNHNCTVRYCAPEIL